MKLILSQLFIKHITKVVTRSCSEQKVFFVAYLQMAASDITAGTVTVAKTYLNENVFHRLPVLSASSWGPISDSK